MTDTPSSSPGTASDVDIAAIRARVEERRAYRAWLDDLYYGIRTPEMDSEVIPDFDALLSEVAALEATVDAQAAALEGVNELAKEGLGEWMSVSSEYVPRALMDFADIRDVAAEALAASAGASTMRTDTPTGGG